jgi:hypothetical protein
MVPIYHVDCATTDPAYRSWRAGDVLCKPLISNKGVQALTKQKGFTCGGDAMQSKIWFAAFAITIVVLLIVLAKLISLLILIKKFYGDSAKYLVVAKLPKKSDIED